LVMISGKMVQCTYLALTWLPRLSHQSSGVLRAKRRQQCTEAYDGFDALELCRCLLRPGARVLNALFRCRWRHDSLLYGAYSATEHSREVRFLSPDPTTASAVGTACPAGTG